MTFTDPQRCPHPRTTLSVADPAIGPLTAPTGRPVGVCSACLTTMIERHWPLAPTPGVRMLPISAGEYLALPAPVRDQLARLRQHLRGLP
jgi:hypothetical protein